MTCDDMRIAIEWLLSYENSPDPDDKGQEQCANVAKYLQKLLDTRIKTSAIRRLSNEMRVDPSCIRAALRRKKNNV